MHTQSTRGFTLIELMVVITIIGLLAAAIFVALGNVRATARDTRRTQDIRSFMTALELYNNDNGGYPAVATPAELKTMTSTMGTYVSALPIDPRDADGFDYLYHGGRTGNVEGYAIFVEYERSINGIRFCEWGVNTDNWTPKTGVTDQCLDRVGAVD